MLADLKEFQAFQRRTKENTPRRMFLFTKRGLKDDSLIFFHLPPFCFHLTMSRKGKLSEKEKIRFFNKKKIAVFNAICSRHRISQNVDSKLIEDQRSSCPFDHSSTVSPFIYLTIRKSRFVHKTDTG